MASKTPNLKVNVNSDTSGFTKGMSTAKKELNAFEKTSNDALGKIAGALGINTDQVQKLQEAFAGAGRKISQMGGEGNKALGQIVASAGKAATAIGAIGIGAAVTAFKLLNEEATAFKNTVAGANIELQTQAYLDTYRQFMHDYKSETGKTLAETEASFTKWWGRTWQNIKTFGVNALTQPQFAGTNTLAATFSAAADETHRIAQEAESAATNAERLQGEIYDLQIKQLEASRRWADQEREIAQLRLEATDPSNSPAERQMALTQLQEKTNSLYDEQYGLQSQISQKMDEIDALAENAIEDTERSNAEYEKAQAILQKKADEQRALLKLQKQITAAAGEEAQARRETAEAIARGVERLQEWATAQIELTVSDESRQALQGFATKPVEVPVRLQTEQVEQQLLDLNDVVQTSIVDAVEGISEALGNLLGNLANGEGGVAQFGQDMLTMFGNFAQKFGKVLIAFGVAVEAAKRSAETFNGIAAIAAGAALVVAGAAVKTIASNMASAMGGAASSNSYVASSNIGGGGGYSNSTLQVEVTGTLTANGSQLVAVLNNENNRKHYTT